MIACVQQAFPRAETGGCNSQERQAGGGRDDREDDGVDKEPDVDQEYSHGWDNEGLQGQRPSSNAGVYSTDIRYQRGKTA